MKSTSIVPVAIALLQSQLVASKGIKVGARNTRGDHQQPIEQELEERDLYTFETIDLEEASCCTGTGPTEIEIEYVDDEFAGTNKTLSPTTAVAPRPTPVPTEVTDEPTPSPTPFKDDDGGLTDDVFIATPIPSGKPTKYGYLPSSYSPTNDDDDWAPGWMPSRPSKDDDDAKLEDDWHGGYPVNPNIDSKAGKSHKGKSGKSSRSADAYRGYGISKVSSLLNSQVSSGSVSEMSVVAAAAAIIGYLYI